MEEYQAEVARAVNNVKHIQRWTFCLCRHDDDDEWLC